MLEDIAHSSSKNPIENGYAVLKSCLKGIHKSTRAPIQGIKRSKRPDSAVIASPRVKIEEAENMLGDVSNFKHRRPISAPKRDNSPFNAKVRTQSAGNKEDEKPQKKANNYVFNSPGSFKLQLRNSEANENLESKILAKGRRPVPGAMRPPSPLVRNGNKLEFRNSNSVSLLKRPKPIWK